MFIKIKPIVKSFIPVIIAVFAVGAIVFAWTEPSQAPPSGNVVAPLNISSIGQSKGGNLMLNTDGVLAYGLLVPFGNVGIGTTTPGSKLTVAGTIESTSGGIKFPDGTVQATAGGGLAVFGNGSDGDVVISADTTITRDMAYNNLTINAGRSLFSNGYVVQIKNTLTLNGTINANGRDGGLLTGGSSGAGFLAGGRGGNGGGQTGNNTGGGGGGGANSLVVAARILTGNGNITAIGGRGGNGQFAFTGGSASGSPGDSVSRGSLGTGGNGGYGVVNIFPPPSYYGLGGAGGQANLSTRTFWVVQAGGAGGGGGGAGASWGSYGAGGGGGGGGGNIFIIYNSKTGNPTFSVDGGGAGRGSNGGSNGASGSRGSIIEIAN